MVFNGAWVAAVATLSANICQYIAFNPQRLSSQEVLDLLCCFPLHQLRRLAFCLCSFFCFPTTPSSDRDYYYYHGFHGSSSSSPSSSSDASESASYDSHSD